MPRKGPAPRRELMPDPVYHSVLVTQVVNKILLRGKRSVAEKIVYDAMKVVEEKTGSEALSTLKRAIENVKPQLESAVRPTKYRWRSRVAGPRRSPFAGWSATAANAARRRWHCAWPTRSSMPGTAWVHP